jgi:hypothetical protein
MKLTKQILEERLAAHRLWIEAEAKREAAKAERIIEERLSRERRSRAAIARSVVSGLGR